MFAKRAWNDAFRVASILVVSCLVPWTLLGQTTVMAQASDDGKPNIVVILADDMGYGDTQTFWSESDIPTPNLDRLAAGGMKLTNYHVSPLCTASRAQFLTGQGRENFNANASANGLHPSVTMLPQFLKEQGYATAGFGKWHLGKGPGAHPIDRGFDKWIGFHGGAMPYFREYLDQEKLASHPMIFDAREGYEKDWEHTTDLFADEAIDFIDQNKSQPFYVHLAFNAVHGPLYWEDDSQFSAPQHWRDKVAARGITNPQDQDYFAVVQHMDHRIGTVLDCLERNQISEITLVFFFSDNGAITRQYYYSKPAAGNNGPFRAGKGTVYEGGIRVPAIARWPAVIPAGSTSDQICGNYDFYPTAHDLLELSIPQTNGQWPVRGRSLLSLLRSGGQQVAEGVHYEMEIGQNRSVQKGDWKMVNIRKAIGKADKAEGPTGGALLFDLSEDPGEENDLAGSHPDTVERLKKLINRPAKRGKDGKPKQAQ